MPDDPPRRQTATKQSTNLPVLVKPTPARKIEELQRSSNELFEKLDFDEPGRILKWAGRMDLMTSSALAGFLGGAIGATAGTTFGGIAIAGFALPAVVVTGPLGMAAGVALAILAWRGPERWRIEKRVSNNRLLLREVDERLNESLKQIKALPEKAPDYIREGMWYAHQDLVKQRRTIEISYHTDTSIKTLNSVSLGR